MHVIFFVPPARRFQVHNDTCQSLFPQIFRSRVSKEFRRASRTRTQARISGPNLRKGRRRRNNKRNKRNKRIVPKNALFEIRTLSRTQFQVHNDTCQSLFPQIFRSRVSKEFRRVNMSRNRLGFRGSNLRKGRI